jgi:hypothetical protein
MPRKPPRQVILPSELDDVDEEHPAGGCRRRTPTEAFPNP